MSYLQESTTPNQMLQQRETMDVKEDQGIQQGILGNYDHVDQSQVFGKTCLSDQAESGKKNSYLAAKKWTVKCEKTGETHDKLVSKQASLKMRRDRTVGKNERHNKVCTSRGLRDRRVRLSAHTAIKFYDVQDRLGYDQPSKAIDWLIEKAKQAIKAVAHELPGQNHDSVDSDIGYIVQQKMKQVLREQSLCNPQCSSYGDLEFQKCDMNVTNMDNEVTFSMPSRFQDCPADQNSTNGRFLCFQSYEDPFGFEFQHSSRIGFTEQALNCSSNLPPNSNPTDPSCLQSPMASDPLLPLVLEQPLLVHRESQFLSQRGTLQSSNLLTLLASTNPPICAHGNAHYAQAPNSNLLSTKRFSSGGFFGFKQDEDQAEEN